MSAVPAPQHPVVIFNPSKATDPAARKAEILAAVAAAGLPEPRWLETTVDDPGREMLGAALAQGADLVLACGGDGTVRACVAALDGSDVPLAILAAGTGNLLAGNLEIPDDLGAALALVSDASLRRIDVGAAGDERFAVMGGLGFDAAMIADADEDLKARIGWAAYILSGARNLRRAPARYTLTLADGRRVERTARGVLIGNVGKLEAGIPVLPDARPDDGLLDIAVLAPATLRDWASLAQRVVRRRRPERRIFETFRTASVRVEVHPPQPFELDGDSCGTTGDVAITLLTHQLRIYAPVDTTSDAASVASTSEGRP
ncbi:MAG: diacylglycerol kinase family protein [Acidimicrobiales bacterium]